MSYQQPLEKCLNSHFIPFFIQIQCRGWPWMLQRVIHGWLEIVGQSVRPHVDAWQKWISLILRLVSMILFRIPSTVDFLLLIFSVWNMEADSLCNLEVFRSQLVAGSCLCCKFYILDVSSSVPFWTVWTWWCTDLFDNIYCLWLLIKKKRKEKGGNFDRSCKRQRLFVGQMQLSNIVWVGKLSSLL